MLWRYLTYQEALSMRWKDSLFFASPLAKLPRMKISQDSSRLLWETNKKQSLFGTKLEMTCYLCKNLEHWHESKWKGWEISIKFSSFIIMKVTEKLHCNTRSYQQQMNGENHQTVKNNKNKIYFKAYANYNVWKNANGRVCTLFYEK